MKEILLLGAGKIGVIITELLASSGDYQVTVADMDQARLDRLPDYPNVKPLILDVTDAGQLQAAMAGKFATLSACPYQLNRHLAEAAAATGVHYLDLTEDVASTKLVKSLAQTASSALIPQCGLAPGFITIATYELTRQFDKLENVHMRVGALPKYPSNALKYNLTWSTDGLINEYCQPCEAIVEGELIQVTTAAGICGVLDLLAEGKLPQQGFVRQEDISYDDFINNRFGRYYAKKQAAETQVA